MLIVFGGAFNPPTVAHLNIVKKLLSTFNGSQVLILPVGDDYKKPELIPFHYRMDMLKLLVDGVDRVMISSLEKDSGFMGTLASLKELKKSYEDVHFVMGSDQLKRLKSWIKYEELLESFPFIIMTRKDSLSEQDAEVLFSQLKHHFTFVPFDTDMSSTQVRKNLKASKKYLTEQVHQYIIKNHLYEE
jgi:nicotinate-nucleotide adenylyltransferase